MNEGEYIKTSQLLFPALDISDSLNDNPGRLRALNSIGNLYAHQNQYAEAARYYERALTIAKVLNNRVRQGVIMGNLGNIYYMQSQGKPDYLKKSESYYLQALKIAKEEDQPYRALSAINNLSMVYADMKNPEKALELCDSAMVFILANNDSADMVYTLANYGRIYRDKLDFKKAIEYYDRQLDISTRLNNRDLMADAYRSLAICYNEIGDYKKAYDYQVLHTNLADTLVNTSNTEIINDLKNKITNERIQSENDQLKQKNEIGDLRNSRQNLFLGISIGGILLLGAFAFLLFNRARVKEEANKTLGHQNLVIAQKNKDITDSINYARRIQESLLASEETMKKFLPEFFIFFKPRDIVSGDFWWITKKEDHIFLCVADCTGHGVPGAFMSLLGISFLNEAVVEKGIYKPNEIFDHVRTRIISSLGSEKTASGNSDGMDGVLCRIDQANRKITFAGANNPLWIIRNGQLIEFRPDKMPVGKHHGEQLPFTLQEVELSKNDIVYLLSDGYADQFGGEHGKKFKYKPLQNLLLEIHHLPMEKQQEILDANFQKWKGNLEQVDDVLLIGFKLT
jgi:serine phosphatase RsbU (regulator of sigma subunit)